MVQFKNLNHTKNIKKVYQNPKIIDTKDAIRVVKILLMISIEMVIIKLSKEVI